jgi:heat shock protein HslJ
MVLAAFCFVTSLRGAGSETISYPLCGTTWIVTHINGYPVTGHPTTLIITGNEASGRTSGGNRYTAKIKRANPYRLHFGPIASTRMASSGASGKQDASFFKWLTGTASYCLDHDYLVLLDRHFSKLIEFAPLSSGRKH